MKLTLSASKLSVIFKNFLLGYAIVIILAASKKRPVHLSQCFELSNANEDLLLRY